MIASLILLLSMIVFPMAAYVPVDFSPTWSYAGGSGPAGEPLLANNAVIVPLSSRTVLLLDARSGEEIWQVALDEQPADTMVVHGDSLFIPGDHGTLMVVSLEAGSLQNAVSLGNSPLLEPLIVGDAMVVADQQGTVSILELDSLRLRSTLVIGTGTVAAIAANNFAIFANQDGMITGLNVDTAEIAWQTITAGSPESMTLIGDGVVLGTPVGDVFMINVSDGSILWRQQLGTSIMMDFAVNGTALLGISASGDLIGIDPVSGARQWQEVLPSGGYFASDACADQCLITLMNGTLTSVMPAEEQIAALGEAIQPIGARPVSDTEMVVVVTLQGDVFAWALQSP